jgi:plasmid stability protein
VLRWLVHLQANVIPTVTTGLSQLGSAATAIVERLECVIEQLGTFHDRKFDAEENAILTALLQTTDGKAFEAGHVRLGRLLGYEADNSDDANITPQQLNDKLSTSCADAMRVESLEEEVT